MPGYTNPQSFNRYSYVVNNPLRYTDPTGHYCVEENGNGNVIRIDCSSSEPIGGGGGGGGNGGGGHDDDDDHEDYCSTHPGSCGLPPAPDPVVTLPAGADYCSAHPGSCGVSITLPLPLPNPSNNFLGCCKCIWGYSFRRIFCITFCLCLGWFMRLCRSRLRNHSTYFFHYGSNWCTKLCKWRPIVAADE